MKLMHYECRYCGEDLSTHIFRSGCIISVCTACCIAEKCPASSTCERRLDLVESRAGL